MEKRKLVTIVTESALESRLLEDCGRLGAKGATLLDARGFGTHGMRSAEWDQNLNVRIEVICDERVAAAIADHCRQHYSPHYALVLYLSDVEVLRPGKF